MLVTFIFDLFLAFDFGKFNQLKMFCHDRISAKKVRNVRVGSQRAELENKFNFNCLPGGRIEIGTLYNTGPRNEKLKPCSNKANEV